MTDINIHKVTLKIFNFDCSPEELTNKLRLIPTSFGFKGEDYFIGSEQNRIKKSWAWNYWEYQDIITKNDFWIGDQINNFIDTVIKPRQRELKGIIEQCECEFSIVQRIYDGCNPGLHFDNERLKVITNIGAEIDVDIYVLGTND